MRRLLTYVLAAAGAGLAYSLVEAGLGVADWSALSAPNDPKLLAAAAAGWVIAWIGMTLVFLIVIGPLWLLVQLALKPRGIVAAALSVVLTVGVSVAATYAMWTFIDMGVDPATFGGLDRLLLLEAAKAVAPGLAWGLVFALHGRPRTADPAPVGA